MHNHSEKVSLYILTTVAKLWSGDKYTDDTWTKYSPQPWMPTELVKYSEHLIFRLQVSSESDCWVRASLSHKNNPAASISCAQDHNTKESLEDFVVRAKKCFADFAAQFIALTE